MRDLHQDHRPVCRFPPAPHPKGAAPSLSARYARRSLAAAPPSHQPGALAPRGCLSPSPTFRFSPVQSGGCSTVGTRAGPVAHHQPPRRHTGFSALPCRFAASAARSASRERSAPSESPPDFRVVFACASPSPCFRFCSLFFSALPAGLGPDRAAAAAGRRLLRVTPCQAPASPRRLSF